jgi:hypothetical protein
MIPRDDFGGFRFQFTAALGIRTEPAGGREPKDVAPDFIAREGRTEA